MKLFEKKNKKGSMVLRDIIMMIIVFTGIIALSSIFVQNVADTYDNVNMSAGFDKDTIGKTQLKNQSTTWKDIGEDLNGNFLEMLTGTFKAAKEVLSQVLFAPNTFSHMITGVLEDLGVGTETEDGSILNIIQILISSILYTVIVFVIVSAFLQGGKL